jgi:hypothetical protein
MSTISPQESQWFKEFVTPFQPQGRSFLGYDLRGTQCDRFGNGSLRLTGYGDSSGGYAFTPANQDAAIAPSLSSANLSNIAKSIPRLTEQQDFAGKWIDTITLHALDEFIEQVEPQSFVPNTLRIFAGGQKDYREDGTGKANIRNTYTLLAEIPIPALTRADIPRSFNVKAGVYVPPAQNLYLGLAIPQPYTCSFEMWDLQANTLVGSGISASIGGSSTVANGNDLIDENPNTPVDTQFILPITFASATWRRGVADFTVTPPPPTPLPTSPTDIGTSSPSPDSNPGSPSPSSPSSPTSPSSNPSPPVPPPAAGGCTPIQDCTWHTITSAQSAQVDMNLNGGTSLCPAGTVARGVVDFATAGSFVLCCGTATYPPNNLGCSSLTKWSCVSGGNCVPDALGVYNTEAECLAALVPPIFTGGQCVGGDLYAVIYSLNKGGVPWQTNVQFGNLVGGKIGGPFISGGTILFTYNSGLNNGTISGTTVGGEPVVLTAFRVERQGGAPDNCGNAPPTCP